jgi:D-alanyl-lipoteichoic acid acyltransferase DltB (MBOAT superfamily)
LLFQTIEFSIFFPIVFAIYWGLSGRNLRIQNAWLVLASFFFYGWWDWRFLGLMIFSAGIDYVTALMIERSRKKRHKWWWLMISLTVNLGILGFFKYYNFFVENFNTAFRFFGKSPGLHTLDIILPIGISFYTLQALSYTIDVYKGKRVPPKTLLPISDIYPFSLNWWPDPLKGLAICYNSLMSPGDLMRVQPPMDCGASCWAYL